MESERSNCPDCKRALQPIKLIDATAPLGLNDEEAGSGHVRLSYAAPDATPSLFTGRIQRLGFVKGLICPECGRISLYGESAS